MKPVFHEDAATEIQLDKAERRRIRKAAADLDQIAYYGRNGAMIGAVAWKADQLAFLADGLKMLGQPPTETQTEEEA